MVNSIYLCGYYIELLCLAKLPPPPRAIADIDINDETEFANAKKGDIWYLYKKYGDGDWLTIFRTIGITETQPVMKAIEFIFEYNALLASPHPVMRPYIKDLNIQQVIQTNEYKCVRHDMANPEMQYNIIKGRTYSYLSSNEDKKFLNDMRKTFTNDTYINYIKTVEQMFSLKDDFIRLKDEIFVMENGTDYHLTDNVIRKRITVVEEEINKNIKSNIGGKPKKHTRKHKRNKKINRCRKKTHKRNKNTNKRK